jgi:hypothetical protein
MIHANGMGRSPRYEDRGTRSEERQGSAALKAIEHSLQIGQTGTTHIKEGIADTCISCRFGIVEIVTGCRTSIQKRHEVRGTRTEATKQKTSNLVPRSSVLKATALRLPVTCAIKTRARPLNPTPSRSSSTGLPGGPPRLPTGRRACGPGSHPCTGAPG